MKEGVVFEPKNKEQQSAIEKGIEFIEKGNASEFFVIVGKAGTGKTTIAQAILADYINQKSILVCALSHKAKLVISEKITVAYGASAIISKSVAGALGMNMDVETGKFKVGYDEKTPAIKTANIIIVDEGSMINEESHELIMQEKKKRAKVIYLGDIRQLPPIRENISEDINKPSPIFYGKNIAVLTERIRQGEESPILPFSDFFGDNSRKKYPLKDPVPALFRKSVVTKKGALVFTDDTESVIETVLPLYKYAVEHKQMNIVKTVTYRNETRRRINEFIRSYIFSPDAVLPEYVVGDLLMFSDNYTIENAEEPISNSYEVQVNSAEKTIDKEYKVWRLGFIYESKPVFVLVLDSSEIDRHAAEVSRLFDRAKKLPFGSSERADALAAAWNLKSRYAPVEYAYAITSHKSQGSTYNTVIVDERDIMSVKLISNKEKSQSMYTAITRASTTCIIISGHHHNEELLKQAVDLSFKNLNHE